MAHGAIESVRADRAALLEICAGLGDGDWEAESGCPGWSVKDVVTHMGALWWLVADPTKLPDATGLETERAQDLYVESRRSWTTGEVIEDYETGSSTALELLAGFEGQDFEVPLGDLGTYPARLLPNAFAFDHYTHIRADLFPPRGPLAGDPPPSDELRLGAALAWVEAALPQHNAAVAERLPGGLEIEIVGIGARRLHLGPEGEAARVTSDAPSFIRWVTGRARWEDVGAAATGDAETLAVARDIKVF